MRRRTLRSRFPAVLLPVLLTLLPAFGAAAQGHRQWSYNLGLYEVNVRQYTQAGTFAAFEPHLDRLQQMGVGILWFMPIHPVGQQNRLGSLGSPYAVRDYYAVNPAYGTLEEFKALVAEIHGRGMYVILDWVANHTAWDHVLTQQHPEWYVRDAAGRFIAPPGTNWSDVIELDYTKAGLRDYMIDAMTFWVEEVGVDGFRFDAVSYVPTDFWRQATAALKAVRPDLFLLAENDGRQWHDAGFDATFGWGLYGFGNGVLVDVARGTRTAAALSAYAAGERAIYPADAYRAYFTSTHDENAWHGTTAELFGAAANAFAVLTATFGGLPLVYSGQEAGLDRRLRFFDKDAIAWRDHPNTALYTRLLRLKRQNRALWNGSAGGALQRVLTTDNDRVYAFLRQKEGDRVFVALNLSSQPVSVTLGGTAFTGSYQDLFADLPVTLDSGAVVSLPAWGYVVAHRTSDVNTGVETDPAAPAAVSLGQGFPNPFDASTTIPYTLARSQDVRLVVFDVLGREVRLLVSGVRSAGRHEAVLHAGGLPSGLYYYRLEAGPHTETKRLVLRR